MISNDLFVGSMLAGGAVTLVGIVIFQLVKMKREERELKAWLLELKLDRERALERLRNGNP